MFQATKVEGVIRGFILKVRSQEEFDTAYGILTDDGMFPESPHFREREFRQPVGDYSFIKWCPENNYLWSSPADYWSYRLEEFCSLGSLIASLTAQGLKIPVPKLSGLEDFDGFDDDETDQGEEWVPPMMPEPIKATVRDALRFVELVCRAEELDAAVLRLQQEAQEGLVQLDVVNQEKEALRILLNIREDE